MLVLSRKQQQEIVIGEEIRVTVLQVKGNTVRLGIEAPRDIRVMRGELPRQSDAEQVANITVVYNDTVDRNTDSSLRKMEILKFRKPQDENICSISFRQVTPEPLRHNRLKQIAREISNRK